MNVEQEAAQGFPAHVTFLNLAFVACPEPAARYEPRCVAGRWCSCPFNLAKRTAAAVQVGDLTDRRVWSNPKCVQMNKVLFTILFLSGIPFGKSDIRAVEET